MMIDRSAWRTARPIALLATLLLVTACAGPATGSVGTLQPRATDSAPTEVPGSPDPATPEPTAPSPEPSPSPGDPSPTHGGATPAPTPSPSPEGTTAVRIYLFSGEQLVSVQREVPRTQAIARAAMEQLLAGPNDAERAASPPIGSNVPGRTLLLGINIRDGLATVDLSREFESGGGSASMLGRLAQVVYTLTQFPTVDRVALHLDGRPVTVFSGEGILIDRPLTRAEYVSYLPPVFVDTPGWGGTLANPGRITGLANVFEASFMVELRDAAGRVLLRDHAMATCGTGCWGTFDLTLPYAVTERQPGFLVVYVLSAKDGSPQSIRTYPVTLTPRT
jgi:germination protein M